MEAVDALTQEIVSVPDTVVSPPPDPFSYKGVVYSLKFFSGCYKDKDIQIDWCPSSNEFGFSLRLEVRRCGEICYDCRYLPLSAMRKIIEIRTAFESWKSA